MRELSKEEGEKKIDGMSWEILIKKGREKDS